MIVGPCRRARMPGIQREGGSVSSPAKTALSVLLAAVLLAGCGVRGALEKPSASGAAAPSATAEADSGQGKKAGDAPKPHKGFILDKLIE